MYKCPECGEIFEEPNYMEVCMEDFYGVGSMFPNRNYGTITQCPYCGEAINTDYDYFYEEDEDGYEPL